MKRSSEPRRALRHRHTLANQDVLVIHKEDTLPNGTIQSCSQIVGKCWKVDRNKSTTHSTGASSETLTVHSCKRTCRNAAAHTMHEHDSKHHVRVIAPSSLFGRICESPLCKARSSLVELRGKFRSRQLTPWEEPTFVRVKREKSDCGAKIFSGNKDVCFFLR